MEPSNSVISLFVATNSSSTTQNEAQGNGDSAQGTAISNVGENGESGDVGASSMEGADVKKAIELNEVTSQSASEVGLSLLAVLCVFCMIMVVAIGYKGRNKEEKRDYTLDELFNERL